MANISKINFKGVEYNIKPLMDTEPTANSTNAVQSGGVKSALDGLQAEIPTVDATPIQGSNNAVSSGGVWDKFAQVENDLNVKAITPITVDNTNFATRISDDMMMTMFDELPNYRKIEGMSIANGKLGVSSAFNCILFQSPYDGFAFDIGSAVGDIYVLNNFPEGNAGETLDIKDTIVGTSTDVTGNLRFTIPDKYSIIIFKFNASYVERMRTAIGGKFKMENLEFTPMQDSFFRYAHTKESTNILPFTLNKEEGKLVNTTTGGLTANANYSTYWFKVPISEIAVTCTNGFRAVLTSLPPTEIPATGYLDRVIYTYASDRVETFTAKYGQYVSISVSSSTDISFKTDLIKTFTLPTLQLDYGQKGCFYKFAKSGSATYLYVYFSSGEKIVGYQLHNVPASGSNSNTWQLGHIMGYDFDGVNVSNGVEPVGGGEFELAFKEFGSADYCGGNNHGDENTIDFVLLIDGKQIDLSNVDTNIHAFDRIDAVEHAYVNRCDTPNDNILKHQKIWIFENGKVKVKQTLEFLQNLNCDFLCCMFAANRTSFTAGVRQGAVDTEIMTDSSFAKKSTSGNEMMYLMYGADVSAKITAKTCAHTPEASLWINPAAALNKLYYNFYGQKPNTAVEEGTIIWWEQEYEVAYT